MSRFMKNNQLRDQLLTALKNAPVVAPKVVSLPADKPTLQAVLKKTIVQPQSIAPAPTVKPAQTPPPLVNRVKQVFDFIKENPRCTTKDIALGLDVPVTHASSACSHLTGLRLISVTKEHLPDAINSMRMLNRYRTRVDEYVTGAAYDAVMKDIKDVAVEPAIVVKPRDDEGRIVNLLNTFPHLTVQAISVRLRLTHEEVNAVLVSLEANGIIVSVPVPNNHINESKVYSMVKSSKTATDVFVAAASPVTATPVPEAKAAVNVEVPEQKIFKDSGERVFEYLKTNPKRSAKEIADALGMPIGMASARLSVMNANGLVESEKRAYVSPSGHNKSMASYSALNVPYNNLPRLSRKVPTPVQTEPTAPVVAAPVAAPVATPVAPVQTITLPVWPQSNDDEEILTRMTALIEDLRVKEMRVLFNVLNGMLKN